MFNDNHARVVYTIDRRIFQQEIKYITHWEPPKLTILTDADQECAVMSPALPFKLYTESTARNIDWCDGSDETDLTQYINSIKNKRFYEHKSIQHITITDTTLTQGSSHFDVDAGKVYKLDNGNIVLIHKYETVLSTTDEFVGELIVHYSVFYTLVCQYFVYFYFKIQ